MDARTLEALKASIKHWEENVAAEVPEDASVNGSDCALCEVFCRGATYYFCIGCPVEARTKKVACAGSPYHRAVNAFDRWDLSPTVDSRNAWRKAARTEVDFLKSLLPPEETK